jgi:hypothetical protein
MNFGHCILEVNVRYLRIAAVHWVDANGSKPPK